MYNNYSDFYKMLKLAFESNYKLSDVEQVFFPFLNNLIKLKRVKKGIDYINSGTEAKKVFLMLTGRCHITKYTVDGKSVVVDSMEGMQIYGLSEVINDNECYIATVTTTDDCYFIEIPSYVIKKEISEDLNVCNLLLKYLSNILNNAYNKNKMEHLNTNEQNLMLYLYKNCINKDLPHKIVIDRKTMASEMNISLRSLYRYISNLKEQKIISINCGKIEVNSEQFKYLESKIEKINAFI